MLGKEHRMSSHRSLLAVVGYHGRSQTFRHKVSCMQADRVKTFGCDRVSVFLRQMKTSAEGRLRQPI